MILQNKISKVKAQVWILCIPLGPDISHRACHSGGLHIDRVVCTGNASGAHSALVSVAVRVFGEELLGPVITRMEIDRGLKNRRKMSMTIG